MVVAAVAENILVRALHPVCAYWGIDGFLHVSAVEVHDFTGRGVIAWVYYAEDVPEVGAGVGYVIDVEARVVEEDGAVDVVEEVASV